MLTILFHLSVLSVLIQNDALCIENAKRKEERTSTDENRLKDEKILMA
jgi:hypothetical protein